MTHLVSVGAGAAATLTALHLARAIAADPHRRARVTFVDPQPQATGAAFGTTDPDHLLNVPASGMSVDPEHRFDFVEWCHDEGLLADDASPYWFAPRMQWARYLRHRFDQAVAAADGRFEVEHLRATATALDLTETGVRLTTTDGTVEGDELLLATGLPSVGQEWAPHSLDGVERYLADPWQGGSLDQLAEGDGDVVVVGSGLTMVDVALTAWRHNPERRVVAISRNGRLPAAHADTYLGEVVPNTRHWGTTLPEVRAAAHAHVDAVAQLQGNWRPAIDGIRYQVAAVWGRLCPDDRLAFVRDISGEWGIHRHRMPPSSAEAIEAATGKGTFEVRAGKISAVHTLEDGNLEVVTTDGARLTCSHLVNCTGPRSDVRTLDNPLLQSLLTAGQVVADPTHLGLVTKDGQCVDANDNPVPIHTLGALRRGELWETTAIPEIRQQAAEIAQRLG